MTPEDRAELMIRRRMEERRRAHPLRYVRLWDHPTAPSQAGALRRLSEPGLDGVLVVGGNGTGKSLILSTFAMAQALGGDHPDVVAFARAHGLDPLDVAPPGPGRVWVASPTFAVACEQLRPHIAAVAPVGARGVRWTDKASEGELHLPGGGVIVSKAYRQYLSGQNGRQSWESAQIRFICFDEHPETADLLAAGLSRTRRIKRPGDADPVPRAFWMVALTHLAGRDWFWKEYLERPQTTVPVVQLNRRHNPHLDQARYDALLARYPEWQRKARESGELAVPQGQRFPAFSRSHHVIPTTPIPDTWRVRRGAADWGARSPHYLMIADNPNTGQLVVYREVAPRRPPPMDGLTSAAFAELCARAEEGDRILGRVGDSKSHGNSEGLTAFRVAGMPIDAAKKGPGSRIEGYSLLERYLRTVDDVGGPTPPSILIMDCCPVLIAELEQLRWEPERASTPANERDTHPEDPDHGVDALRYELQRREEGDPYAAWLAATA